MSVQTMNSFIEKALGDEVIAEKLVAIIDENEGEAILTKMVALAGESGYAVTEADVAEVRNQIAQAIDNAGDAEGDLSDSDLENVAGGSAMVAGALTNAVNGMLPRQPSNKELAMDGAKLGIAAGGAFALENVAGGSAMVAGALTNAINGMLSQPPSNKELAMDGAKLDIAAGGAFAKAAHKKGWDGFAQDVQDIDNFLKKW